MFLKLLRRSKAPSLERRSLKVSSISFIVLISSCFWRSIKALKRRPQTWWFSLRKKFYLAVRKGITNYFTSKVSLSMPSEFPVTDLRLGPKKTKNFFMLEVISSRSRRIPTMYLHLSTRGAGWNSHLSNCSSSMEVCVRWNSASQLSKIAFPWIISSLAACSSAYALSVRLKRREI